MMPHLQYEQLGVNRIIKIMFRIYYMMINSASMSFISLIFTLKQ